MMSKTVVCLLLLAVVVALGQQVPTEGLASIPSNFNISEYIEHGWPIAGTGVPDVVGAFRFICNAGHLSYDDPIVYPGQPGKSHLHQFYGNTLANAHSTYETLRKTGNSTCQNILNRSAYWMPAMMNGKGGVVRPDYISIYYKRLPKTNPDCQTMGKACIHTPRGLRMVFGYDYATDLGRAGTPMGGYFNCDGPTAKPGHYPDIVTAGKNCPVGNRLGAVINMPSCWDGKNLDSANHREHLAYADYGSWGYLKCPDTHQYIIPSFTLGAWFTVDDDLLKTGVWNKNIPTWSMSSDMLANGTMAVPGSTFHADWFGAWDDVVMNRWHDNCIDKLLSCSAGDLGDGSAMKMWDGFKWEATPRVVPVPANPGTGSAGTGTGSQMQTSDGVRLSGLIINAFIAFIIALIYA